MVLPSHIFVLGWKFSFLFWTENSAVKRLRGSSCWVHCQLLRSLIHESPTRKRGRFEYHQPCALPPVRHPSWSCSAHQYTTMGLNLFEEAFLLLLLVLSLVQFSKDTRLNFIFIQIKATKKYRNKYTKFFVYQKIAMFAYFEHHRLTLTRLFQKYEF